MFFQGVHSANILLLFMQMYKLHVQAVILQIPGEDDT